ncbi:AfsA-related hotdog domain-containing protein [Rhodococcus sp. 3Y1]
MCSSALILLGTRCSALPIHATTPFDHPVDHIPGMILFEAARQALRFHIGNPATKIASLGGLSEVH